MHINNQPPFFLNTPSEKTPLLSHGAPSTSDASKLSSAAPPTHTEREAKPSTGAPSRAARPESLVLDQSPLPMKLVRKSYHMAEIEKKIVKW